MIFINGLLNNLQEYDECFHNQADEIDRLNAELEASLERERIQAELLELYRQLQSAQSVQHQELLDKIQHLTQQIEELSKKSASRRKATPGASEQTDAERRKGIEARIKRVLANHDKMLKELEALDAKAKDGSATSSSQGTTEPVESDESETDRQVQSDDHADSSDIPGQEKDTPAEPVIPPLADSEPNNPPLASSAPDHPDAPPSHDSEELPNPLNGGPSDSDECINAPDSVDGLLETIRDMEEKLNRISDEMEERIYEANKGPRDSNTPSGKAEGKRQRIPMPTRTMVMVTTLLPRRLRTWRRKLKRLPFTTHTRVRSIPQEGSVASQLALEAVEGLCRCMMKNEFIIAHRKNALPVLTVLPARLWKMPEQNPSLGVMQGRLSVMSLISRLKGCL